MLPEARPQAEAQREHTAAQATQPASHPGPLPPGRLGSSPFAHPGMSQTLLLCDQSPWHLQVWYHKHFLLLGFADQEVGKGAAGQLLWGLSGGHRQMQPGLWPPVSSAGLDVLGGPLTWLAGAAGSGWAVQGAPAGASPARQFQGARAPYMDRWLPSRQVCERARQKPWGLLQPFLGGPGSLPLQMSTEAVPRPPRVRRRLTDSSSQCIKTIRTVF